MVWLPYKYIFTLAQCALAYCFTLGYHVLLALENNRVDGFGKCRQASDR